MAKKKIAINGMGRIGRLAFRALLESETMEVAAVNDIASMEVIAYLTRHDSEHGPLPHGHDVRFESGFLVVDGKPVPTFQASDAKDLPWKKLGIDLVLECTGSYTSRTKASQHLETGAMRVLVSAASGADIPTIVYGINEGIVKESDLIVSGASCSTVGLSVLAQALNRIAPIQTGVSTTIHALTPTQMALDNPQHKGNLRRSRTSSTNIIPTTANAAKAVELVLPELAGKLTGSAIRVPITRGSYIQLVAVVDAMDITAKEINERMRWLCVGPFGYADEELVSSDIAGTSYESIFDPFQTKTIPMVDGQTLVEVATWFDNETSYISHFIKLAELL